MSDIQGALLLWREENQGRYGEGISRPVSKAKTKLYTLIVYKSGSMPMTMTFSSRPTATGPWPSVMVFHAKPLNKYVLA